MSFMDNEDYVLDWVCPNCGQENRFTPILGVKKITVTCQRDLSIFEIELQDEKPGSFRIFKQVDLTKVTNAMA